MARARTKIKQSSTPLRGGWWFVKKGAIPADGWSLPFVASSKAAAMLEAELDENSIAVLFGPFESKWKAWSEIHKWISSFESLERRETSEQE